MTRTLLVFARDPTSSNVKTRLSTLLTGGQRSQLYAAMLRDTLDAATKAPCEERVVLWASQPLESVWMPSEEGWEHRIQVGSHLGVRMVNALKVALSSSVSDRTAVLIGSDAPLLMPDHIESAFEHLRHRDFVLGPSYDGGYYLVGARSSLLDHLDRLFEDIPWSTSDVFERTCERLAELQTRHGATLALLPTLDDIDTPADVHRLRVEIRARSLARSPVPRYTTALLRTLDASFSSQERVSPERF